jgi:hypothetical protein
MGIANATAMSRSFRPDSKKQAADQSVEVCRTVAWGPGDCDWQVDYLGVLQFW